MLLINILCSLQVKSLAGSFTDVDGDAVLDEVCVVVFYFNYMCCTNFL